ncbi:oligopeptide ABC transporter ATP-binding protein [Entomoplasma ellychniae]|uniref:Oligopeptide ABC transporter ATP-binding protein n=1 Tax=Entomoplasma ellychniae TaxID=2114 RepID=A0A8E2QY53_9MOLU|nr:oligopeptide ABC transporter ATP-binding protein OppF [Entomoplasma ellychniae]PPE04745.1 oligopeptide ABC transporter ATP-binding protein [Entomoplasma ellychniae]
MLKDDKEVLLNVRDLVIEFRNKGRKFQAVKNVSFDIYKQEIFGLVGESGSGKTTIGRAIAGVQEIKDGSIYLDNQIVAGQPTSLYKLNQQINKNIYVIENKYIVNCNYIEKLIFQLKLSYVKYKDNPEMLIKANWKKVFASSKIALIHHLTKDCLKFINQNIKNFERINQFVTNIHNYIPEVPIELENSILAKNVDTKDIFLKLKEKISLDFFDLDEIQNKVNEVIKNKKQTSFIELLHFIFTKLELIKLNNDKILRRINIAKHLEKQNLDLSAPRDNKNKIIKSYYDQIYIKKLDFKLALVDVINQKISISKEAKILNDKLAEESNDNQELIDLYITDLNIIKEFWKWKNKKIALNERQTNNIVELIKYLKLPSIDDLVQESYLFSIPTKQQKRQNRKNIQMIFQDPGSSLNERMSVENVIAEGLENFQELYKSDEILDEYIDYYNSQELNNIISKDNIKNFNEVKKYVILKLIESVGLLPEHLSRYPHEFSGGQKQRIGIARSLALKPKIIIADEPISALDVSIRAQVLNLFQQFKEDYGLTYFFVTHDLSVVKFIADRIAVIYHGEIVEMALAEELFKNPLHPYTKSLLSAIPVPDPDYVFDKELIEYRPWKEHYDYIFDMPKFVEFSDNHFVLANKREIEKMKKS